MFKLTNLFSRKSKGLNLVIDPNGMHNIGGKPPTNFIAPKLEQSPLVYIGCISKKESYLKDLEFDLHLCCPMFIDLRTPLFMNYSEPLAPQVIYENVATDFFPLFDDIKPTDYIEYSELHFNFDQSKDHSIDEFFIGKIGHSGTPQWIREEDWPSCPISGNKMKFLCQFSDIDDCEVVHGEEVLEKEDFLSYLNFAHGYLYLFYDADSKVVAYLNQY